METLKEIFEGNTDKVLEAIQKLLEGLGDREGQFVWKKIKTESQEIIVTNPSFTMIGEGSQGWKITSATFDYTQVTLDFFDGFKSSDSNVVFAKDSKGKVQLKAVGYTGSSLAYTPSSGYFQNNMPSQESPFTVSYSGTKTYTGTVEIVDYVVADDAEAYPNGGTQDGYWYELVEEGLRGIDYGTVTLTSTATSITVEHNLKSIPSYAIIINNSPNPVNNTTGNINGIALSQPNGTPVLREFPNTLSAETVVFKPYINSYYTLPFGTGTYHWFVKA